MNTQPIDPKSAQMTIEQRMRTVRILWLALLASIPAYFMVTIIAGRPEDVERNDTLSLALVVAGVAAVLVSFLIKKKLLDQAIAQQQVQNVQQAYIVAWAICEMSALLGLFDFFRTSHPHYYVPFVIAALGVLLHYPRREHFDHASVNPPITL
jgi:hypothetical protein